MTFIKKFFKKQKIIPKQEENIIIPKEPSDKEIKEMINKKISEILEAEKEVEDLKNCLKTSIESRLEPFLGKYIKVDNNEWTIIGLVRSEEFSEYTTDLHPDDSPGFFNLKGLKFFTDNTFIQYPFIDFKIIEESARIIEKDEFLAELDKGLKGVREYYERLQ